MSDEYHVGQRVLIHHWNTRGGRIQEAEVSKVGRKLVYIEEYGRPVAYRIDTGNKNDQYGHSTMYTPEAWAARERRADLDRRLREGGLDRRNGTNLTDDQVERIVAILES